MGTTPERMPSDARRLRLLVCDDSSGFRALVANWFAQDPDLEVVAGAASAREVLDALAHRPDVVLLDRLLPDADADRDLAAEIKQALPACTVVLVSGMPQDALADAVARTAADACASKATSAAQLRSVILEAARGLEDGFGDTAAAST
jgi:two-component system, NarL family, response regulator DesR